MRALISVSDKTGVVDFAKNLKALGWEVIATGGTMKLLRESGVEVLNISDVTGFPEICDGRVKTLHPAVHGGLLARRDVEEHVEALRANGMHAAHSIVHTLAPTIEGAMTEMLEVLDRGDPLANCYFAENDLIAIGAMKAFKQRGYRIPEDIAIVGFDNISEGQVMEPALTTVNIPRTYMGRVAVRCLINAIQDGVPHHIKVEVSTDLVIRSSVVRSSHTP